MVTFQELRITPDGQKLIIDVSVKNASYYKDVYLGRIDIDTQDTFINTGFPSSKALKIDLSEKAPSKKSTFGKEIYKKLASVIPIEKNTKDIDITFKLYCIESFVNSSDTATLTLLDNDNKVLGNIAMDLSTINNNIILKAHINNINIYVDSDNNIRGQITIHNLSSSTTISDLITYLSSYEDEEWSMSVDVIYNSSLIIYPKSKRLELDKTLIPNISKNLFFVYVMTSPDSIPAADTPCGEDNVYTMGVTSYLYPIYKKALNYVKDLEQSCLIPKNFINYILQYKAFKLAIKIGQYTEAIKYWKKFFMNIKESVIPSNCGCHG